MKIYTKTGDSGSTSLIGGTRVSKDNLRIEAYGTVDELNAFLGLLADQPVNQGRLFFLRSIQERLFTLNSALASESENTAFNIPDLKAEDIEALEKAMDEMDAELPALRNFILPGGHASVSIAHIARTVCRRAERNVVALSQSEFVAELIPIYLNRLSDYFFVLGRKMSAELEIEEVKWRPRG